MDDDIERVQLDFLREKALKTMPQKKRGSSRRSDINTRRLEVAYGLDALRAKEDRLRETLRAAKQRQKDKVPHTFPPEAHLHRPARYSASPDPTRDRYSTHYGSKKPSGAGAAQWSPPRKKRRVSPSTGSHSSYTSFTGSRSRSRSSYSSSSRSRSRSSTSSQRSSGSRSASSVSSRYSHSSSYSSVVRSRSTSPETRRSKTEPVRRYRPHEPPPARSYRGNSLEQKPVKPIRRGSPPTVPYTARHHGDHDRRGVRSPPPPPHRYNHHSSPPPLPPRSAYGGRPRLSPRPPPPRPPPLELRKPRSPPPLRRREDPYHSDHRLPKRRPSPPPDYYDRYSPRQRSSDYGPGRPRGPPPPPPPRPPPPPPRGERRVVRRVAHRPPPDRSPPPPPLHPRDYYDDRRYDRGRPPPPPPPPRRREEPLRLSHREREYRVDPRDRPRDVRPKLRDDARGRRLPSPPRRAEDVSSHTRMRPPPPKLRRSPVKTPVSARSRPPRSKTVSSKFEREHSLSDAEEVEEEEAGGRKRETSESVSEEMEFEEKISKPLSEEGSASDDELLREFDEEEEEEGLKEEERGEGGGGEEEEGEPRPRSPPAEGVSPEEDHEAEDLLGSSASNLGDEELDYDENMEDLEVYPTGSLGEEEGDRTEDAAAPERVGKGRKRRRSGSGRPAGSPSPSPPPRVRGRRGGSASPSEVDHDGKGGTIHSPIRVSPEHADGRPAKAKEEGERLPVKERLFISRRTIKEKQRAIRRHTEDTARLRPSLANRLGPSPTDHGRNQRRNGGARGSAVEIAEAYRRKKRQQEQMMRAEDFQKAKNITKLLNDDGSKPPPSKKKASPAQAPADGHDREQDLDRRISKIKEQNKAIMKRKKEIERDKQLHA